MEETKRERSVERKIYASIVENLDTEPENAIAGPKRLHVMEDNQFSVIEKKGQHYYKRSKRLLRARA